jgi:hypothetical protein
VNGPATELPGFIRTRRHVAATSIPANLVGRRPRDGNTHRLERQPSSVSCVTDAKKRLRNRLNLLHVSLPCDDIFFASVLTAIDRSAQNMHMHANGPCQGKTSWAGSLAIGHTRSCVVLNGSDPRPS